MNELVARSASIQLQHINHRMHGQGLTTNNNRREATYE